MAIKSAAEIEVTLREAAERMRQLSKAAKDQAARETAEPADNVRSPTLEVQPSRPVTIPPR